MKNQLSHYQRLHYDDFKTFKNLNIDMPSKEEIISVKIYISNKDMLIELYKQRKALK